jgi:toxin ParE1/3/4
MRYDVQISDKAEEDLDSIIDYLLYKLKAPGAADTFLATLEQKIEILKSSPKIFKIIDDDLLRIEEIRVLQVSNYLAFYLVDDNSKIVSIIRVLYGRRDWLNILLIKEV